MEEKPKDAQTSQPEGTAEPKKRELRPFPLKKVASTSIYLWVVAFVIPSFLLPVVVWVVGNESDKQIADQMLTKEPEDKDWLRKSVAESVANARSPEEQAKKAQEQGILSNAVSIGEPTVFTIDVGGVKKKGSIVFPQGWAIKPGATPGMLMKAGSQGCQ